jgi:potassium-transporting ATPase KdpC subunit
MIREQLKTTITIFFILTVITGIIYPLVITGIAQLFFNNQANGSIIVRDEKAIGSSLIGQPFDNPKYFWGRPSVTSPMGYNSASSSGSNLGPSNPALADNIKTLVQMLQAADPCNLENVPVDLVTASASGLDPHISVAAAMYQVPRVARLRGISQAEVIGVVKDNAHGRLMGIIGEPTVNVLQLNLTLDKHGK